MPQQNNKSQFDCSRCTKHRVRTSRVNKFIDTEVIISCSGRRDATRCGAARVGCVTRRPSETRSPAQSYNVINVSKPFNRTFYYTSPLQKPFTYLRKCLLLYCSHVTVCKSISENISNKQTLVQNVKANEKQIYKSRLITKCTLQYDKH